LPSSTYDRAIERRLQTPDKITSIHGRAHYNQLKPVIESLIANGEFTAPVRSLLQPGIDDHIHHIVPLRTFNNFYKNLEKADRDELQQILRSGNVIDNLIVVPKQAHHKGIHTLLKRKGLEFDHHNPDKYLPLLVDIENAGNLPMNDRRILAQRFVNEVAPLYDEFVDSALQEEDALRQALIDRSAEQKSQDFAESRIGDTIMSNRLRGSGDINDRGKDISINSEGGNIYVSGDALRQNGNGNGKNGKHKTRMAGARLKA